MFPYSGTFSNNDPSVDFYFVKEFQRWGFQVYKSFDLIDQRADNNYGMLLIHKYIAAGDKLSVVPYTGVELVQNKTICDKGSDLMVDVNIAYKLGDFLLISNDALFQNIGITKAYNWTNRIKLALSSSKINAAILLWERNRVFHNQGYLSTGFTMDYKISLSRLIDTDLGIAGIWILQSDSKKSNGVTFTLGLTIHKKSTQMRN